MRTRAATAQLVRTQLEFSGDPTLRGDIWTDVRTAYDEALRERVVGVHVSHTLTSNRAVGWVVAAVLIVGLLTLAVCVLFRGTADRPTLVAVHEPNARAITDLQALPGRELAEARQLFERKDLARLVRLLDSTQPETRLRAAEYLAQIGDDSALPALQRLADQWQGPAGDNPFRQAIETIQARRTKTAPQPAVGEREPNRAAGKPVDEVKPGAAGETKPLSVTGIVRDKETGKPIAGAQVGFRLGEKTVTDAEGRFTLVWPNPSSTMLSLYAGAPGYAAVATVLRSKESNLQEVVFALSPGARLAVTVVDPNGSPVPGAKLRLSGLQTREWDFVTDANGRFEFEGLDPAVRFYNLEVVHPGYPYLWTQISAPAAGQTLAHRAVLKPGVAIFGQMTDPNGRPVAGATVGNTFSAVAWNSLKVRTDEQGMYRLGAVDRGDLLLWATHAQFRPFVMHANLPAQETRRRIDIRMEVGQVLKGRVVDDLGNPVGQATVKINRYNDLSQPVETDHPCDADGRFVIPNAPSDGVLGLYVSGPGIIGTSHKVDFSQAECVILIPRLGRIYGKVLDAATGVPVRQFKVKLSRGRVTSSSGGFATTWAQEGHDFDSAEGLFDTSVAAILPVGATYRVTVQAEGYDPVIMDSVVAEPIGDHPARTEFRLRPATIFAGRVLAADGRPLEGGTVLFFSGREASRNPIGRWPSATTDKTGAYTIAGLDSEPQCLLVRAPGFGPCVFVMADLLTAPGRLQDIVLEPAASLAGRVVDEHGKGIVNAQVQAQPNLERIRGLVQEIPNLGPVTQTDAQGHYLLSGVPAGKVSIYAYLPSEHREIGRDVVDLKPGETTILDFVDKGGPAGGPLVPSGRGR